MTPEDDGTTEAEPVGWMVEVLADLQCQEESKGKEQLLIVATQFDVRSAKSKTVRLVSSVLLCEEAAVKYQIVSASSATITNPYAPSQTPLSCYRR